MVTKETMEDYEYGMLDSVMDAAGKADGEWPAADDEKGDRPPEELPKVEERDGRCWTTSLNVAAVFGKRHSHVMRDVAEVVKDSSEKFGKENFEASRYVNSQNREQPMYLLSRNGAVRLLMRYTGRKAGEFQEAYIETFDRMEEALRARKAAALPDFDDPIAAAEAWIAERKARALAEEEAGKARREAETARNARDEALRTKSHIAAGRDASAMRTAALATRRAERLRKDKEELLKRLDRSEMLSVAEVDWRGDFGMRGRLLPTKAALSARLKAFCAERGLTFSARWNGRLGCVEAVFPESAVRLYLEHFREHPEEFREWRSE